MAPKNVNQLKLTKGQAYMITNTEMSIIVILAGFPIVIVPPATTAAWPILVIGFPVFGVCPQSGSDKNNAQNIYVLCIFFCVILKSN